MISPLQQWIEFGVSTHFDDLPESVVTRTRVAILDTLAALVAGHRGETVPELAGLVTHWGGRPESTLAFTGSRVPAPLAALVNGTMARALDLDDVHEQNTCHISAATVPAAFALAEAAGPIEGRDLIVAIALGSEFVCRLSAAPRISFSETGHSLTYQCGILGATLTAARLLRLDSDRTHHALGIAYACLAGNQQGFIAGSSTVRLMQGVAAEIGVRAALMAQRGLTGATDILEGRFGYYRIYQRERYEPSDLTDGLGQRWLLEDVSIKPVYPCCKFIHGPISDVMEAMKLAAVTPENVSGLIVKISNREAWDVTCAPRERKMNPGSVTDAQFSLPFMIAWAAVYGDIGFTPLAPESLNDQRVRAMMQRVEMTFTGPEGDDGRGIFPMPGEIALHTASGDLFETHVAHVKGHPRNPMSLEDVTAKLAACADWAYPSWTGGPQLLDHIRYLERLPDTGEIIRLCAKKAS